MPITPPPTTVIVGGTWSSSRRMPSESMTRRSSKSTLGPRRTGAHRDHDVVGGDDRLGPFGELVDDADGVRVDERRLAGDQSHAVAPSWSRTRAVSSAITRAVRSFRNCARRPAGARGSTIGDVDGRDPRCPPGSPGGASCSARCPCGSTRRRPVRAARPRRRACRASRPGSRPAGPPGPEPMTRRSRSCTCRDSLPSSGGTLWTFG